MLRKPSFVQGKPTINVSAVSGVAKRYCITELIGDTFVQCS
jgi:hypothetical protein